MTKHFRFSALNLALSYIAVTLAVLGVFATPLWYAWRHSIEQRRTEVLQSEVDIVKKILNARGMDGVIRAIRLRVDEDLSKPWQIILLTDPNYGKLAGNLSQWPRTISDSSKPQVVYLGGGAEQIRAAVLQEALPNGYHLLVGRDIGRFEKLEALFLYGLAGSGLLVLLIAILGGLVIRKSLLARVERIRQAAAWIVAGDLSHRLQTSNDGDELGLLTETINRMLNQIESLVTGVSHTTNAIAHDLRTPLAELRSRLEELSVVRPPPEETFIQIESAISDVDRVIAIFNALLRLAEIDSGARRSGVVTVDITKLTNEVTDFYQPVAEINRISLTFRCSKPLSISGDPLLLAQAISNMVENALKYGAQHGMVQVEVKRDSDRTISVTVADDGPGIPDAEKSKVVERFYRIDISRASPGVGLGLSLVAAVAKLHGGSLLLEDNRPGLRAIIILASDQPATQLSAFAPGVP